MNRKIFKSIVMVAVSTLLATLLIITGCMYEYFGGVQENQLLDELGIAAQGTETVGENFLTKLKSERYRITWIDSDGSVLFDNRTDRSGMENHADREEVQEALSSGTGSSSRYSTTLTEKTLYKAVRLSDGTVLRISCSRATAAVLLFGMIPPILIVLLVAIVLSAVLGSRMAKRIVEPLNRLDLEHPLQNEAYDELSPLLRRIDSQHKEIHEKLIALKQKRDEFEQITGNMHEGLILLDQHEKVISINAAAKKLFHVSNDCIGADVLSIYRKNDLRHCLASVQTETHAKFQAKINGREYQFDLSKIESDGNAMGTVILVFDITEQVEAERTRREFTANVSHELKTPLQGILGYTDLIENGLAKQEDVPRFISHIRKETTRLVSLIDDIIRLSQLDEGTQMPLEEVSLLNIAEEVCESLSDKARAKQIEIAASGDDGYIIGVHRLLYETVYNLCDNSLKYNKVGGSVQVTVNEKGNQVQLSVTDTGIGIAPEDQERVFERFYRVDKSHSKQSGGTGLGLSIVKHAVAYHHGVIEVDSKLNQGTTITVTYVHMNPKHSYPNHC